MNTNKFEAFAEEMREVVANDEARHAMAEKIVKYVSDSIAQTDLASLVLPKEVIPVGQTAEYAVRGQLKAYWHEPGSYAPRTRMTQKVFVVPTWMVSAHPEYEISQLEAGRYGTAQDQVVAARDAILGAINARVFNTLSGSITSGDRNYFTVALAPLSQSALDQAVNHVEDQIGSAKVIIGRRNLLYPLLNFNQDATYGDRGLFSDSQREIAFNNTKLPTFRGIPVIGLPQWRDGFGKMTIPQNEILVVGQDVGKYVVNQELRSKDDIDVDNLIWHIHLYMKMGCAVFFPERMAKITIVSG